LTKLDVLVDMAARNADVARHPNLVETIRHHCDGIVDPARYPQKLWITGDAVWRQPEGRTSRRSGRLNFVQQIRLLLPALTQQNRHAHTGSRRA
jgi:hypothetical protein